MCIFPSGQGTYCAPCYFVLQTGFVPGQMFKVKLPRDARYR